LPAPATSRNRFERHPVRTALSLLAIVVLAAEGGARLLDPEALRFARQMRRVHRYSGATRVDLVPGADARLRLSRTDGSPLLDFRLAVGPDGFRVDPGHAPSPAPPGARWVHAIGDSYTMGWGVEAHAAWPAVLERLLPAEGRVLNLGVDGFGAIGATARSAALADRYPPAVALYLFSPNDPGDDERAAAVAARPRALHAAAEALDAVRRHVALASAPFALRYRLQFRRAGPAPARTPAPGSGDGPERLLRPSPGGAALPAPDPAHPTFAALRRHRDALAARGAVLRVMILSTQEESLRALRFCREEGIEAVLFDVPDDMRIPDEGHFDEAGHRAVAALARALVE
jgi:lysophospholipase L1-like esterase